MTDRYVDALHGCGFTELTDLGEMPPIATGLTAILESDHDDAGKVTIQIALPAGTLFDGTLHAPAGWHQATASQHLAVLVILESGKLAQYVTDGTLPDGRALAGLAVLTEWPTTARAWR